MRDALDGVVEYDPQLLVDHDLDPFSYTGNARFSQGFFDRSAALGHPVVLMIQETISTRSQEGYDAGVFDCQFAESRARERGWTGPIAYVVSDGNGGDAWDASEYGRGIGDAATVPFEVGPGYGSNGVIPSFVRGVLASSGARLLLRGTDGDGARWVPETWPGGTNAVGQVVGFSPVPDTDLNHVYIELGAPAPAPAPRKGLPEMFIGLKRRGDTPAFDAAWVDGGFVIRWLSGDNQQPWGPFGLTIPQAAFDFAGGHPGITTEILSAGEWAPIEKRTAVSQQAPVVDVVALAAAVAAKLPPGQPVDPVALAEALAGHLTITVTPKL